LIIFFWVQGKAFYLSNKRHSVAKLQNDAYSKAATKAHQPEITLSPENKSISFFFGLFCELPTERY
jgi:hypothetical protein